VKQALWDRARLRLDRFSAENLERFALIDPARYKDRPASAEAAVCVSADDFHDRRRRWAREALGDRADVRGDALGNEARRRSGWLVAPLGGGW
jgi:hypothetical protein